MCCHLGRRCHPNWCQEHCCAGLQTCLLLTQTLSKNVNLVTHAGLFWLSDPVFRKCRPILSVVCQQSKCQRFKKNMDLHSALKNAPMIVFLWILRTKPTAVPEQEPWGRTQLLGTDMCWATHHPAVQGPSQIMAGVLRLESCSQQRNRPKKSMSLSPELVNLVLRWEVVLDDPGGQWHHRDPYKRKAGGLQSEDEVRGAEGCNATGFDDGGWSHRPRPAGTYLQKLEKVGNRWEKSASLQVVSSGSVIKL